MTNWIEVGTIEDIPKLGSRVVEGPDGDIAIFRNSKDEIFALNQFARSPYFFGLKGFRFQEELGCR